VNSDLITAVERYRSLVESAMFYEDDMMVEKHKDIFNEYVLGFAPIYDASEIIGGSANDPLESELDNIFNDALNTLSSDSVTETVTEGN